MCKKLHITRLVLVVCGKIEFGGKRTIGPVAEAGGDKLRGTREDGARGWREFLGTVCCLRHVSGYFCSIGQCNTAQNVPSAVLTAETPGTPLKSGVKCGVFGRPSWVFGAGGGWAARRGAGHEGGVHPATTRAAPGVC